MGKQLVGPLLLALALSSCGTGGPEHLVGAAAVPDTPAVPCPGEERGGTIHDYPAGVYSTPEAAGSPEEALERYLDRVRGRATTREFVGARFVRRDEPHGVTFEPFDSAGQLRGAVRVEGGGSPRRWVVASDWTCQGEAGRPAS